MVGYAYMDLDGNVVYKVANYIDNINPGFFGQNRHLIAKHWKFDTTDVSAMLRLFKSLVDLKVTKSHMDNFIKSIGYDMNLLKNADKV